MFPRIAIVLMVVFSFLRITTTTTATTTTAICPKAVPSWCTKKVWDTLEIGDHICQADSSDGSCGVPCTNRGNTLGDDYGDCKNHCIFYGSEKALYKREKGTTDVCPGGQFIRSEEECTAAAQALSLGAPAAGLSALGSANKCTCPGGTPATGVACTKDNGEICTECKDAGYTLTSDKKCKANKCTCPGGTPATGVACTKDNGEICTECKDAGYTFTSDKKCKANKCTCPGGTPATGVACTKDNGEICTECKDAGYTLTSDKKCKGKPGKATVGIPVPSTGKSTPPSCTKPTAPVRFPCICRIPPYNGPAPKDTTQAPKDVPSKGNSIDGMLFGIIGAAIGATIIICILLVIICKCRGRDSKPDRSGEYGSSTTIEMTDIESKPGGDRSNHKILEKKKSAELKAKTKPASSAKVIMSRPTNTISGDKKWWFFDPDEED